jgi:hypothetical protein
MKPNDTILIDGHLMAVVEKVQTGSQIAGALPMLSEALLRKIAGPPLRVAVITFEGPSPEFATGLIVETGDGWKTIDGESLTVALIVPGGHA